MRPVQRIITLRQQRVSQMVDLTDTYAVRLDKPYAWLQRICCWVLGKLGAHAQHKQETIKTSTFDPNAVMDRVIQQYGDVFEVYDIRPTKLFIGADDFRSLMHEVHVGYPFTFAAEYTCSKTIFNMEVHVIPWMSGVVVLP